MEMHELIYQLNNSDEFPTDIVNELIARKDESTPVLLRVLEEVVPDYKRESDYRLDYISALYILSYFREPRAFPYVIKLALLPADWAEKILGEHLTKSLTNWIVSTYNGDLQAIKNVIENETAVTYARSSALYSLIGLVTTNHLTREEVIEYLRTLMHSELVKDYEFSTWLVYTANKLYPEELYPEIKALYARDLVEEWFINEKNITDSLALGKEKCLQQEVYGYKYHLPITNIADHMPWLVYESEDEDFFEEEYHVPKIKLGRNDPCCCGSDKKYKKCCLTLLEIR